MICITLQSNIHVQNWEGIMASRERLVEQFQNMLNFEQMSNEALYMEPQRLLTMLRQAGKSHVYDSINQRFIVAFQIESNRHHPQLTPRVTTLLQDYTNIVIPNKCIHTLTGHQSNVKCVHWVGDECEYLASGSSDNTIKLWHPETFQLQATLEGHRSKVWDVCSNRPGTLMASGSGDGTAKLWDLSGQKKTCAETFTGKQ